jgi:hypothetical protein
VPDWVEAERKAGTELARRALRAAALPELREINALLGDAQARGGSPAEVVRALRGAQAASDRIAHHVDTSVDEDLAPSVPSSAGGFGLGSDSSPRRPMAHPPHLIGGS